MLKTAFDHLQNGDPARAEAICRHVLAGQPNDASAMTILGLSLQAQQRFPEAVATMQQLLALSPTAETWANLGNVHRESRDHARAEDAYRRALALQPNNASFLFNLGLLEIERGDYVRARDWLDRAHRLAPDDVEIRIYAAEACYECVDMVGAEALLGNFREWPPIEPLLLAEVSSLLIQVGMIEDGERALQQASARLPDEPRVQARMALHFERTNRLDEARAILERLPESLMDDPLVGEDVMSARARLVARGDDLAAARVLHERLLARVPDEKRQQNILFSLAKVHERAGDVDAMMATLARAHRSQLMQVRELVPELLEEGANPLAIVDYKISAADYAAWPVLPAPGADESPIFVVGFPRSGTTMLETMLDAHPNLRSMDERPFLQNIADRIRSYGYNYPEQLDRLSAEQCEELRALYWSLVRQRVELPSGTRLVDKNPLNLLRLPMIRRVFPNSKIILALRHPCDVVLSNYMQAFRAPAFVAMCATLETTARGYAHAMGFWIDQAAVFQPDTLQLRYENIVDDVPTHARRIVEFLGLPWDERMVAFHEHAKSRGFISTPSYAQVVEPVNKKGVGRWQRYRTYFEPVMPLLRPFIERWGYDA